MPHTRMLDGWSLFQKMLVAAIVVAWDTVGLGVLSTIETAMTSTYKMLDQLLTDDAGNGWQLYIRLVDHDIEQVAQQTFGDCSFWEIHLSLTCLRFMKVISTFLQEGSPQVMSWCWRVGVDPFFFSTNRHLSYHKSTKLSRGAIPMFHHFGGWPRHSKYP